MKLVLASKNKKKLVEMNAILGQLGIEVCSEAEAGVDLDVEESGGSAGKTVLIITAVLIFLILAGSLIMGLLTPVH